MEERKALYEIKMKLLSGIFSYDEAKIRAAPYIDSLNKKGSAIAKKYGRRFVKTTFSSQMR
jgi:hypothetical protein